MAKHNKHHRRKILQYMTPALGIMTAGCSSIGGSNDGGVEDSDGDGVIDSEDYAPQDPDVQDESDVETSTEEEEETDQEEQEQESDSSDDEQLVEYDSVVDLLPEPNTIATDDDWQVTGVEQDPDTDLQVDVTAFYTVGGAGAPSGNVAITAYDNISDAEQRYDDSFANAELEAESVDDTTPVNTDETYRAQIQRSDLQASRLKNVFFQVSSSTGHTTDIHAAIVSHLNDKIVSE